MSTTTTTKISPYTTLVQMELVLQPSFPLFFAFILFLYAIVKHVMEPKFQGPPGPRKLPLIGNLHHLIGSFPHRALSKLAKKYGPVMHLQLGEISAVIISSAEMAKEVMMTKDLSFANRGELAAARIGTYNYTDIAFAPYGEYWRQLKKICVLELLSSKRVQSFKSIRESEVKNLINSISDASGAPINLSDKIFSLTNLITAKATFGKSCKEQDEFILKLDEGIKIAGGFSILDIFPSIKVLHWISGAKRRLLKMQQWFDKTVSNIVEEHRSKRETRSTSNDQTVEEDLLDVLLKLQEGDDLGFPLTTDNIKAVILDMFSAGSNTISTTIEWIMSELIRNPKLMEKAQREVRDILKGKSDMDEADIQRMNYLKMVIKETLRFHPPGPLLLPREARETCEIDGYNVPIKTKVIINYWAIGRDPKYWADAERFEPDRFKDSSVDFKGASFEYIPFGAGRRICPGITYAIAVIDLVLAQLLYHFDWKLPNGMKPEELDMTEAFGASVRRKNDLLLVATPYIS